ncbi:MAG TPA: hypothetical protein VEC94_11210 [Pseudolabrys sp.]|nr:hypothetical protein [Pseudolabrys sp.]
MRGCPQAKIPTVFHATKSYAAIVLAAVLLAGVPSRSNADTGAVEIKLAKVGLVVGAAGGSGTLIFHHHRYRLRIRGVSAGTIGASGMRLVGTASNLRYAADIAGTYSAVSTGIAVAGGAKTAVLRNSRGVVLQLEGKQVGLEASVSVAGLTISLK